MGKSNDGVAYKDCYDIVRRSDGAIMGTLRLKNGDRTLLSLDQFGLGQRCLQKDERLVSFVTLTEMVKEMSLKN